MNRKSLVFIPCLLIAWASLQGKPLDRREQPVTMTTSVIIPCIASHFKYIDTLLYHYQYQTCPPDEVVISLSEIERLGQEEIDQIEDYPWPFSVIIVRHQGKKSAGENRTIATAYSSGDLIICQDADDFPHPQRIEIIKYIFEHYYVDHLLHGIVTDRPDYRCHEYWDQLAKSVYPGASEFPLYQPEEVFAQKFDTYDELIIDSYIPFSSGNPSFTREVANRVHWSADFDVGEDEEFNAMVYDLFKNKGVARAFLYKYRTALSSFETGGNP